MIKLKGNGKPAKYLLTQQLQNCLINRMHLALNSYSHFRLYLIGCAFSYFSRDIDIRNTRFRLERLLDTVFHNLHGTFQTIRLRPKVSSVLTRLIYTILYRRQCTGSI